MTPVTLIKGVHLLNDIVRDQSQHGDITTKQVEQLRLIIDGFFTLHSREGQDREAVCALALKNALAVISDGGGRGLISSTIWATIRRSTTPRNENTNE